MNNVVEGKWGPSLEDLTAEQQVELAVYGADHSLKATARWLKHKGVEVALMQLNRFLDRRELQRHLEWCAEAVDLVVEAMRKREPLISPEELRKLSQRFFTESAIAARIVRDWTTAEQAAARRDKLEADLDERRAEKERLSRQKSGETLVTPELFEQVERELNLL